MGRDGSGRVGSGRVGVGSGGSQNLVWRVGSGQEVFKILWDGTGRVGSGRVGSDQEVLKFTDRTG